jgi:hypothetical protein
MTILVFQVHHFLELSVTQLRLANLKRSTKQEIEIMRFNEGYTDDNNTVFTKEGYNQSYSQS